MTPPPTEKCTTPRNDDQRSAEVEPPPGTLMRGNTVTQAFWPRLTESKERHRLLFVMRNVERIDRLFGPDWLDTEQAFGKFIPTDQNIPSSIKHLLPHTSFIFDPPITTLGKYTAQMVGRAMSHRGATPRQIVCSPALRCVQTASAIASLLGLTVGIEYGLAEPHSWFVSDEGSLITPEYISPEQFATLGYSVDPTYVPVLDERALRKHKKESEQGCRERVDFVLRYLGTEIREGPLLVIGHAITLQVATDMANQPGTIQRSDGEPVDVLNLGLKYPYGSVVSLARVNKAVPYAYRICRNLIPPLTFGRYFSNKPIVD